MPDVLTRSLPGIRFVAEPPPLDEVLPRMDIAVFVGFARRGPLHTPIPIEDAGEFEAIFGADAPLAWDHDRGEAEVAHLGPAVRAFFRNGGTRCWIVRVAGDASTNRFPLPGVARLAGGVLAPAFARASSPGSWSDGLRVGTSLAVQPFEIHRADAEHERLVVQLGAMAGVAVARGDLLRLQTRNHVAWLAVDDAAGGPSASPPSDRGSITVAGRPVWFRTTSPSPLPTVDSAVVFTASREPQGSGETFSVRVPLLGLSLDAVDQIVLLLQMEIADAPGPGSLVAVDAGSEQLWVTVSGTGVQVDGTDPNSDVVEVRGRGVWWLPGAPAVPPEPVVACARVELDLWVRETEARTARRGGLGLAGAHPRFWARLPDDAERLAARELDSASIDSAPASPDGPAAHGAFPLAGGPADGIYLPLGVAIDPDRLLGAARQPRSALERDGLAVFGADLFVDAALVGSTTDLLMDAAEHLRYTQAVPRGLRGVHAALAIEEATLIAVPDASHRGWTRVPDAPSEPPGVSPPMPHPSWWRSILCDGAVPVPAPPEPPFGRFIGCGVRVLRSPRNLRRLDPGQSGSYTLAWDTDEPSSVLEEARLADYSDAVVVHTGSERRLTIFGRPDGTYYYRVRAASGTETSDWSDGLVVRVASVPGWQVVPSGEFAGDTLLAVHRALLRVSAARGDLLAVLAAPAHFREDQALAHARELRRLRGPSEAMVDSRPAHLPLAAGEARALSHGALYHPWLVLGESEGASGGTLASPDGAMSGVLSRRARQRGAWIAPANEPLAGVLALSPPLARHRRGQFLEARVNLVTQEPRGFLTLSADTLSLEADLTPIGVRRLLSLLRRLALREAVTYVFEPHDAAFRRMVQRSFESFLSRMFERGAFAGATAASSYRVVTDATLNTPQSVDLGRFVVELRVAPALPLTFLTVRLVQSGDRTLVVEGR